MRQTLTLPEPHSTDLGLRWTFQYRGFDCSLIATETTLRLWMDSREIDPSRVLNATEFEETWLFMCQPHVLTYGIIPRSSQVATSLLGKYAELILHRYADVLEGFAPPGFGNQ